MLAIIVDAARAIISEEGLAELDLSRVSYELGVPSETVVAEIATTKDLLAALDVPLVKVLDAFTVKQLEELSPGLSTDSSLGAGMDPASILRALTQGYYEFARERTHVFYSMVTETELPVSEGGSLGQEFYAEDSVTLQLAKEACANIIRKETSSEPSLELVEATILCWWANIHGIVHLLALGILRNLGSVVRTQLLSTAFENFLAGLCYNLRTPVHVSTHELVTKVARYVREHALQADEVIEDPERRQLMRGVRAEILKYGVDTLSLSREAEAENVKLREAAARFRSAMTYGEELERHLDRQMESFVEASIDLMGEDTSAAEVLCGIAASYFTWALDYPDNLEAIVLVATQSIVPTNFDRSDSDFEMGRAYSRMTDWLTQAFIEEGAPKDAWLLFHQAVVGWATVLGISHLCSRGFLEQLPEERKFALFVHQSNIMLAGLMTSLHDGESV